MADLKFGNVTPAVGNIKLGSNNVSEIYQGTTKLWPQSFPPSPGEVTVCDLVWTRENSIITTTNTGGANIPIVTNQTDWVNAISNQQPAACYWDFDSNNAFRGLLYNVYTTEVIQPPAGFRLPTEQDFTDLRLCVSAGSPQGNMDVTSLANNYYGFWPSTLASNPRFGTVDFNAIGSGYTYKYGSGSQQFTGQGVRDIYWVQQPSSFPVLNYFRAFMTYDNTDYVNNVRYLQGFNGNASNGFNHGFSMRFVKDVPTSTVELYDCQSPFQCSEVAVVDHSKTYTSSGGGLVSNPNMSIIVPTQQSWSPTWEICVNLPNNITVTQLQLRLYSDSLRQNLVHTYQKNIDPSDQSPPCNTPEIFTFADTTLASGTYYCRTLIYNNRSGTGPFVITALIS